MSLFFWKWDSKARPRHSRGKKQSGGLFLRAWENPNAGGCGSGGTVDDGIASTAVNGHPGVSHLFIEWDLKRAAEQREAKKCPVDTFLGRGRIHGKPTASREGCRRLGSDNVFADHIGSAAIPHPSRTRLVAGFVPPSPRGKALGCGLPRPTRGAYVGTGLRTVRPEENPPGRATVKVAPTRNFALPPHPALRATCPQGGRFSGDRKEVPLRERKVWGVSIEPKCQENVRLFPQNSCIPFVYVVYFYVGRI
jgi:hypothetical protein